MLPPRPSTLDPRFPHSPLVTIAIPTYNRADTYLPQALQSALSQTYPNIDIVVSDNCSTDHTRAFVTGINNPRVRYFRHEPSIGQKGNYSFCVEQARGTYLLLLHDDDIIDEDFVSSCIAGAGGAANVGIIRTGVRLINADGKVIGEITNEVVGLPIDAFFRSWFLTTTAIYCCNTLFNTQNLRAIGGFKSKQFLYGDTMAIFRLAAQHPRIDIPEVKASFRIHGGEFGFSRKIADWCEDSLELLQFMCDLVPEDSRDQILKEGTRFFSRANYHRASTASSSWERAVATMKVMRYFNYRRLPSFPLVVHVFYGTRLYNNLRFIKRRAIRPFQRLATD
jgi:glycosyltransferase involved in cell wall biosynthesis